MIDGVLNLHKPRGITSAKALYRVRKIIGERKSGHAGSLDPMAEGVLVLCFGRATKLVELWMNQPKVYRAMIRLDVTSESFDADRPLVPVEISNLPSPEQVRAAFAQLAGAIQQTPPAVSALKIAGRPAYKYERAGIAIELKPRPVTVYWIVVHDFRWPNVDVEIACGRGTYIRAIARDVGQLLGAGGCLTALARTQVGPFHVRDAWTLERLEAAPSPGAALANPDIMRDLLAASPVTPAPPTPYPEPGR